MLQGRLARLGEEFSSPPVFWPRDDSARTAKYDVRAIAAMAFLASASVLLLLSLTVPGYVAADGRVIFAVLGVGCAGVTGLTAWLGYLSGPRAAAIIAGGDVAVLLAALHTTHPQDGRVVTMTLTLPTMFVAVFMTLRWLYVQGAIVVAIGWSVFSEAGVALPLRSLHTLMLVVAMACPAVVVLVLRSALDRAVLQATTAATTDPLTGLTNRRGLNERYPAVLARARREGLPVGVIVADVDHFKRVNDVHGHAVGDQVLCTVADAVAACVRGDDIVCRLGGEELAVVAASDAADLLRLAERIRAEVERVGERWPVTVSIGVTWRPAPDTDPGQRLLWAMVDEADDRMYAAKRAGRNRVGLTA